MSHWWAFSCGSPFTLLVLWVLLSAQMFVSPFSTECHCQKGLLLLHFMGLFFILYSLPTVKHWKQFLPNDITTGQKVLCFLQLGHSKSQRPINDFEILWIIWIHICMLAIRPVHSLPKPQGFPVALCTVLAPYQSSTIGSPFWSPIMMHSL